jgi:hypothetical protein
MGATFGPLLAMPKTSFRGPEAQPDVPVCCRDKFTQCNGVHLLRPAELHVPHAFACAFQEAGRVVEHRPVEESDIHMTEGVDVPNRISHTRSGMAIVQKLANVRSAAAHLFKPWPGEPSQLVIRLGKPSVDAGVSLNGTREPQESPHRTSLPAWLVMSKPVLRRLIAKGDKPMADEKLRVLAFDTVQLDVGDWDGPNPNGEFLTYTSKHAAASIKVTKSGKTVLDADFGAKKTVMIDDDVIHVPEGAGKEI